MGKQNQDLSMDSKKANSLKDHPIYRVLESRVLVMDGAMGSLIQEYGLTEADFRGKQFANFPHDLKGNNDFSTQLLISTHSNHIAHEVEQVHF